MKYRISLKSVQWERSCMRVGGRTDRHITKLTDSLSRFCKRASKFYVLPTQCIYVFCVDLRTNSDYFPIQHWLVFITETECLLRGTDRVFIYNSTFCPHCVCMCFVWIWEQTALIFLYSINWLVFITETECVYCAVRTESLYIILRSAHTVYLCVLCGSENKQRLFPYTALNDWFL